ncbi:MAG: hypothetical protein Q7R33_05560, partial [Nitrosarchaeum sp.]|nr:hypothetical protein [Nitrosarchaeum sp.]
MKYKVGDKVKISSTHIIGNCGVVNCASFNSSGMYQYRGQVLTISANVGNISYHLQEDIRGWNWSNCMLEKVETEKIEPKNKQKKEVCCECETKIKADQFQGDFESEIYCEDCFDEKVFTCSNCNKKFEKDESYTDPDDNLRCEYCYSESCFVCDDCNDTKWTDDSNNFDGSYYCNGCIEEHARECSNCGELESVDTSFYCDSCDNNYCEDCSDHGCDSDNFEEQNQDLDFQEGKKTSIITVDRYVGVELEAENGKRRDLNLPNSFGIKGDGSLNESGVEIVTPPAKKSA